MEGEEEEKKAERKRYGEMQVTKYKKNETSKVAIDCEARRVGGGGGGQEECWARRKDK